MIVEQEVRYRYFQQRWIHPDCGGEMKTTGVVFTTYPERYQHKCNVCGFLESSYKHYPSIRTESTPVDPAARAVELFS